MLNEALFSALDNNHTVKFTLEVNGVNLSFYGQRRGLQLEPNKFYDVIFNEIVHIDTTHFVKEFTVFDTAQTEWQNDINTIKTFFGEHQARYRHTPIGNNIIKDHLTYIPVFKTGRVFSFYDYEQILARTDTFFQHAKNEWLFLLNQRQNEITNLLYEDKAIYASASNTDGLIEVQSVIDMVESTTQTALTQIKECTNYEKLIQIWPVLLLPKPPVV